MNSGIIVGILIAVALVAAVLWKLGVFSGKKPYSTEQLPVNWPERFASYYYTPQGVSCNFENPMTQEAFDRIAPIIDMGIRNLLRGFPANWTAKRNHSDYIIGFIKPTATNEDGSPALMVNGVQSAGTILGYNTAFKPVVMALPQQTNWDYLSYLMHSVWFEGEHDGELANDPALFWQYVGAGDVHPHRAIENPEMPLVPLTLIDRRAGSYPSCDNFDHLRAGSRVDEMLQEK